VAAGVRRLVAAPHLEQDLEGLLQLLEALGCGRERDAEPATLLLVPAGPDSEPGSTAGEDVQGGDDLAQDARATVVDAGHHRAEGEAGGLAGQEGEEGVPLEHGVLGGAVDPDLEEVVHDGDGGEAGLVGEAGDLAEIVTERGGGFGPGEVGESESDAHRASTKREDTATVLLYC
jgi:hypothetical protein